MYVHTCEDVMYVVMYPVCFFFKSKKERYPVDRLINFSYSFFLKIYLFYKKIYVYYVLPVWKQQVLLRVSNNVICLFFQKVDQATKIFLLEMPPKFS